MLCVPPAIVGLVLACQSLHTFRTVPPGAMMERILVGGAYAVMSLILIATAVAGYVWGTQHRVEIDETKLTCCVGGETYSSDWANVSISPVIRGVVQKIQITFSNHCFVINSYLFTDFQNVVKALEARTRASQSATTEINL